MNKRFDYISSTRHGCNETPVAGWLQGCSMHRLSHPAGQSTPPVWPWSCPKRFGAAPAPTRQMAPVPSFDAVATRSPARLHATAVTERVCPPVSSAVCSLVATFHSAAVELTEPVINEHPSGLHAKAWTAGACVAKRAPLALRRLTACLASSTTRLRLVRSSSCFIAFSNAFTTTKLQQYTRGVRLLGAAIC